MWILRDWVPVRMGNTIMRNIYQYSCDTAVKFLPNYSVSSSSALKYMKKLFLPIKREVIT